MFIDADLPGREIDFWIRFLGRAWHPNNERGNPKTSGDYSDAAMKSSKAP
jgi:hypothetical protein